MPRTPKPDINTVTIVRVEDVARAYTDLDQVKIVMGILESFEIEHTAEDFVIDAPAKPRAKPGRKPKTRLLTPEEYQEITGDTRELGQRFVKGIGEEIDMTIPASMRRDP